MKKTIKYILISIFLLAGIYFAMDMLAKEQLANMLPCSFLTKDQCIINDNCALHGGPTVCIKDENGFELCPPVRTNEPYRCGAIDFTAKKEAYERQKEDCKNNGGEWRESGEYSGKCDCVQDNSGSDDDDFIGYLESGGSVDFVEGRGCVKAKEECEYRGGTWLEDFEPVEVADRPDVDSNECRGQDPNCSFFDGDVSNLKCYFRWDKDENKCISESYKKTAVENPCKINGIPRSEMELFRYQ